MRWSQLAGNYQPMRRQCFFIGVNMTNLIAYENACRALTEARQVDEVKDIRDKAQAMAAYAKQAKNTQLEVDAAEIRIRAERKLGQMLKESERASAGRPKIKSVDSDDRLVKPPTLSEMGISKDLSSQAQKLAEIPEAEFESTLAEHREEQRAVTGRMLSKLDKKKQNIAQLYTGEEEHYTPGKYIESARKVMGCIDLDPASNPVAQETVKAARYFTKEDNGLQQQWSGNVWMNPPYTARVINQFIEKLVKHYQDGDVDQAVLLTNNSTDTTWFHIAAQEAAAICFTTGRISFLKNGKEATSPTNGQCFFYFGHRLKEFREHFSEHGLVMVKA